MILLRELIVFVVGCAIGAYLGMQWVRSEYIGRGGRI